MIAARPVVLIRYNVLPLENLKRVRKLDAKLEKTLPNIRTWNRETKHQVILLRKCKQMLGLSMVGIQQRKH
jgi:hypothetical protein